MEPEVVDDDSVASTPGADEATALAKPGDNYGSCLGPAELDDMIPPENLCSSALFLKNWSILWPLLGPIVVIIVLNILHPHELTMDCDMHHSLAVELVCSVTKPAVRIFPRLSILLGLILLAWRMEHERAYYILMSNRIMLDFQVGKRFAHWVTITLVSLFIVSILHFCLKFFAGHLCPGGLEHCQYDKYMMNNTPLELLQTPALFNDARNKQAKDFFNAALVKFVIPGAICLSTLFGLLNIESELMPMSKMVEAHPRKVYRQLSRYIFVQEPVLRKVLHEGLEIGTGDAECSIADVCKELYEKCQAEGCIILGSPDDASVFKRRTVKGLTVLEGVAEVLDIEWWPSAMLLNLNLAGENSVNFKKFMGLHFSVTIAAIAFMQVLAAIRIVDGFRFILTDFSHSHTVIITMLMVSVEIYVEVTWMLGSRKRAMGLFAKSKDLVPV